MTTATKFQLLSVKCQKCKTPLLRRTQAEADDSVFCVECGAFGGYKEVIEGTAGLVGGVLTPEQIVNLREHFRLARKSSENDRF